MVQIENANDNTPRFTQDSYSFSINEGSYVAIRQRVGMVTANDLDSDGESPYGRVYYSFENKSSKIIPCFRCQQTTRITFSIHFR
jgi:hypothetical protein